MRFLISVISTLFVLTLAACDLSGLVPGEQPNVTATLPGPTVAPPIAPGGAPAAPTTVPHEFDSRVDKITLDSAVLGVQKSLFVYLPPGYEDSDARYPVLYLFRGHEKEWVNPAEDRSRGGHTVIDVYERLLAEGQAGAMILVFPGMSSDDNAIPGMATNMAAPENAGNAPGIGTGRFEDYFIEEVVPFIDRTYRTSADASQRGLDGFSLGGFMATKLATEHFDKFGSVGAFDGLYFFSTADCQLDDPRDNTFDSAMFAPAFDAPRDTAYAAENNAPTLICRSDPAAIDSLEWFIQFGPESAEPQQSNYYRGEHLLGWLESKGVENGFDNPILEGGHTWAAADEHMRQTLPLHWQALSD